MDVGGGFGIYAGVFCEAAPHLKAVVLDLPEVAALGREEAKSQGLSDRIEFIGGDFHATDYGSGYDLVLLANILHQEKEEGAYDLVQRSANALAPGGTLAIVDFIIDEDKRENLMGAMFAINMRSFGDTYPESKITSWLERAGLGKTKREDLIASHWLITGRKPG